MTEEDQSYQKAAVFIPSYNHMQSAYMSADFVSPEEQANMDVSWIDNKNRVS